MSDVRTAFPALEGGFNARDLGGHATNDGSRVRTGLVFRSATLSALTPGDLSILKSVGIRLIVDMRATDERLRSPSPPLAETWAHDYDASDADFLLRLRSPAADPVAIRHAMAQTYRGLIHEQAPAIAQILRRAAKGELPLLFHCAAGKDRTGAAAALLLAVLGVPRNLIRKDYVRSSEVLDRLSSDVRRALAAHGVHDLDDDALRPILVADPCYLDALLDEVEREYGTAEVYAYRRLGIAEIEIAALRSRLLERADQG